jgi:hypothetical protein
VRTLVLGKIDQLGSLPHSANGGFLNRLALAGQRDHAAVVVGIHFAIEQINAGNLHGLDNGVNFGRIAALGKIRNAFDKRARHGEKDNGRQFGQATRVASEAKTGEGWGHGHTLWACDSRHGNCTDFHSVFISMARAEKIPARFQIGFPLPADKHSAEIPGYHRWAEFYLDSTGWVPIDISEAWKHPEKHDYFFGAHDVNRVPSPKVAISNSTPRRMARR